MRSLLAQNRHLFITKRYCYCPSSSFFIGNDTTTTIAKTLNLASNSRSSAIGNQTHCLVVKLGLSNDIFLQNNLIKMYTSCGVFRDGHKVFDEMPMRNLFSWTLIISGANQNGVYEVAVETFLDMIRTGLLPNEFTLGSIMRACISLGADELGSCVHCFALKIGMGKNPFVGSSIMHMYAQRGEIEAARRVFEGMDDPDLGCWNAMIGGYAQCGYGLEAVNVVSFMHSKGILMDEITFINALNGCLVLGNQLDFGSQIHGLIVRSGFKLRASLVNSLMDMYFKNGGKELALKLFDTMDGRDVVSWNTIFAGTSQDADANEIVGLFRNFMVTSLKPNCITFLILFRMCRDVLQLHLGLQLYCLAFRLGLHSETHVSSSLINMFSRCGAIEIARSLFDSLSSRNVQNLNEMIRGYNLSCDPEALKLFANFWNLGFEPNEFTFSCTLEACFSTGNVEVGRQIHDITVKSGFSSNGYVCSSLVNGYVRFGLLDDSFAFFNGLEKLDIASWGTLISALVNCGFSLEAIKFLNYLKEDGKEADEFILGSILNGCASIASNNLTKSVHTLVIRLGFETHECVASAIIDAYGKSGDIESTKIAFCQSYKYADVAVLNTMISVFAHHGLVKEALEVFERMKVANLKPSQATFVSLLSACNYLGLVDLGHTLFRSISLDYEMVPSPENYGCLVDLMSRNGFLQEAKCIIEMMPFPPWPAIWRSLLHGCRIHGDRELGEFAAKKLFHLFPDNNAAYVLLSKVYSEDGSWEDAAKLRREMIKRGIRKHLGCSWIDT